MPGRGGSPLELITVGVQRKAGFLVSHFLKAGLAYRCLIQGVGEALELRWHFWVIMFLHSSGIAHISPAP